MEVEWARRRAVEESIVSRWVSVNCCCCFCSGFVFGASFEVEMEVKEVRVRC